MNFYAHTAELPDGSRDPDESHWQPLATHLRNVAELAKGFAAPFGLDKEAELAGLLHDLGKYASRFQERLRNPAIHGINHWAAGTFASDKKRNAPSGLSARGRDKKAQLSARSTLT